MTPIPMVNIGHTTPDHPAVPGEYFIHRLEGGGHIAAFICPNGKHCGVPIKPAEPNAAGCAWDWNGNDDSPTLAPSINCNGAGGCGWHGSIQNGVMT